MAPYRPRSASAGRRVCSSRSILAGMAKKPEPPKPTTWTIYKIAAKAVRLGTVEATDEAAAIEKAAAEFKVPNEPPHPMFVQVDFGLVRDARGDLQPKLVELQAFPSLYAYQGPLAQAYIDVYGLEAFGSGLPALPFALSSRAERGI